MKNSSDYVPVIADGYTGGKYKRVFINANYQFFRVA